LLSLLGIARFVADFPALSIAFYPLEDFWAGLFVASLQRSD
jgi:hypothetical protein